VKLSMAGNQFGQFSVASCQFHLPVVSNVASRGRFGHLAQNCQLSFASKVASQG
jgi:hypothetical protein